MPSGNVVKCPSGNYADRGEIPYGERQIEKMKASEYLDQCKAQLHIPSDYALAKKIGLSRFDVSRYRSGSRTPDAYACVRIAVILGLDPAQVIADLHSQGEQDAERRRFWTDFLSRASRAVACTLVALSIALGSIAAANPGGVFRRRGVA